MSDIVIKVENLGKRYRIGGVRGDLLSERLGNGLRSLVGKLRRPLCAMPSAPCERDFWALRDVSFEVKAGDVVGIIGRNGSGKSTLLKILSRITSPTTGKAEIYGRVGSLLEVGTGFHPELTGRENILLNGAILGMSKSEIRKKFDEIVAFAEVEKFVDTPVKHYSSGMYVRLAFAVAAHLEPEILIVDEVLAVGDVQFQKKCLGKMGEVAKEGRTVLFVSHNMGAVQNLCNKGFLLNNGSLISSGRIGDVINQYLLGNGNRSDSKRFESKSTKLQIINFQILAQGNNRDTVQCGESLIFEISYGATEKLNFLRAHIVINTPFGDHVLYLGTDIVAQDFDSPPSAGKIICTLPKCSLSPGQYAVDVHCTGNRSEAFYAECLHAAQFYVVEGDYFGSGKLPPDNYAKFLASHNWSIRVD